jgi:hypothetical protein
LAFLLPACSIFLFIFGLFCDLRFFLCFFGLFLFVFISVFLRKVYILFFCMVYFKVLLMGRFRDVSSVSGSDFVEGMFEDEQPDEELIRSNRVEVSHPEPDRRWGECGDFRIVGHGEVTNPNTCGKFAKLKGCIREDLHRINTLDGKNFSGKVFWRKTPLYCYKSSCPVCYKSGWAVREAERGEYRLKEASKRFGLVEHIVLSVPVSDYHLSFKALRGKARKVLESRGVIGGCVIFHGFRYKPYRGWFWSPHFHVLGFVLGGYARCRDCKNRVCMGYGNYVV